MYVTEKGDGDDLNEQAGGGFEPPNKPAIMIEKNSLFSYYYKVTKN